MSNNPSIKIDFLYLDLSVCTRCQDTGDSIEESLNSVSEILKQTGVEVVLNPVHIQTPEQAVEYQFVSSPTIRINGQDIQMEVKESHCDTCSSLTTGASVDCRDWEYQGKTYSAPPKAMIMDAVLRSVYGNESGSKLTANTAKNKQSEAYSLPENLQGYFENKDQLCAQVETPKVDDCGCDRSTCCTDYAGA